ncbi:F-box protein SKIP23 [Rhynchospora pubera]|uniref:F-box protein SKIP23 n=1 Tax=Rhynchospora pubera TaxID=906938 RepID=A0AAV8B7G6_9POAL|nr:F-box protein SKIP23 [Rhynchospora pubera]KAJ4747319.1 F-box protein SKIP23 [Rhynchospora pubera]
MVSWSDLCNDALGHIIGFLSLPDLQLFSAVCRNWRWVAKQNNCSPAEQLPWLMMREDASTKKRKFYSLTEKRHYYIDIPELHNQCWIGSSFGWLFIVDRKFIPRLFNPFTRECYELPLLPKFEEEMLQKRLVKVVLFHDPSKKSDFTVLFLYRINLTKMAVWLPGENRWRCIPCMDHVADAIFFRGNFYLACSSDLFIISDVGSNPTMKLVMPLLLSGIEYLVDFMGELLLVERHLIINLGESRHHFHVVTERFAVHKLNLEEKKSFEYKDFGDYAIFLGTSCPLVVNSQLYPGCKRNSIYFTDLRIKLYPELYGCDDIGVYDFARDAVEPFYPPEIFHPLAEPPIWLTPNVNKL